MNCYIYRLIRLGFSIPDAFKKYDDVMGNAILVQSFLVALECMHNGLVREVPVSPRFSEIHQIFVHIDSP